MTMQIGPSLELLLRRLVDTPPDFLDPPRRGGEGRVHVAAVVNDLFALHGVQAPTALLATLSGDLAGVTANQLTLSAIVAWLLTDESWMEASVAPSTMPALFTDAVPALATEAEASRYVFEPERREELARTALFRLSLLPAGETANQAADRLASVSGVERRRLLEASRAAEDRARAIREALARKAAEESADKWTRE